MNNEIKSPVKAIRQFCLDCCGGSAAEVRTCTSTNCALKAFRFGKNPYINRQLTDEQKEARAEQMRKINRKAHDI